MHFVITKRLQTIALLPCYLMKKKEMKTRFLEHKEDHVGFPHGFKGGRKKAILVEDTAFFREFVRMERNLFQFLVEKLWNHFYKEDTKIRKSMSPDEKLVYFYNIL